MSFPLASRVRGPSAPGCPYPHRRGATPAGNIARRPHVS